MSVKIEKDTTIGDNNAIGDNATVNVTDNIIDKKDISVGSNDSSLRTNENRTWFTKHPWISGITCSLIAGIIMLLKWDDIFSFIKELFK